jgi:hypothetical protein
VRFSDHPARTGAPSYVDNDPTMEFQTMEINDVNVLKGWKNTVSPHPKNLNYGHGKRNLRKMD